jgi:membrane protease YdiL (CAAX protease family)
VVNNSGSVKPEAITIWGSEDNQRQAGPGWRHIVLGFFLAISISVLYAVGLTYWVAANPPDGTTDVNKAILETFASGPGLLGSFASLWAGFMLAVVFAARATPGGWRVLLPIQIRWKTDLPLAFILLLAVQGGSFVIGLSLDSIGISTKALGNTGFLTSVEGSYLPYIILATVFGAPIVEELFFRGVVLQVTSKTLGVVAGVILTSILFGMMHIQANLAASIYTVSVTAMVGMAFAILRLRTGRLGTPLVAHILFNAGGVGLALLPIF